MYRRPRGLLGLLLRERVDLCSWRCRERSLQLEKLGDACFGGSAGFDGGFQVERSVSQEANSKAVVSYPGNDAITDEAFFEGLKTHSVLLFVADLAKTDQRTHRELAFG